MSAPPVPTPDPRLVALEQIRLVLSNVRTSLVPASFLVLMVPVILGRTGIWVELLSWCALTLSVKAACSWHAQRGLKDRLRSANTRRLYAEVLTLTAAYAVIWSSLVYIVLPSPRAHDFLTVSAVLIGVAASLLPVLSPLLPVFLMFIALEYVVVGVRFWQLGDVSPSILSAAFVLFAVSFPLQARSSSRSALAAIRLRFENAELSTRWREEADRARTAHQAAEEANLAKSKFLAAASHDLRQPIHALGLFLSALEAGRLSAPQRSLLASATSANRACAEMLDTLLDFSRLEAGVIEPAVAPFRLQPLLHQIEQEFAPQAEHKGLVYRSRDTRLVLSSDAALVALIVRNLVANAIRYTDAGGVLVAARWRGRHTVIEVWDTGIGIAAHQQADVFKEFHQLGNPERDRRKGLGLGLAIARGLAEVMGHRLSMASVPGRGSVFRLVVRNADERELTELLTRPALRGTRQRPLKVLVLDDDEQVRLAMSRALAQWDWHCTAVETIDEAVRCAAAEAPDVFVCDHRLRSQTTGTEAIRRVREAVATPHNEPTRPPLPALLVTGDTAAERLREAHAIGARVLHKPLQAQVLHDAIVDAMATRAATSFDTSSERPARLA